MLKYTPKLTPYIINLFNNHLSELIKNVFPDFLAPSITKRDIKFIFYIPKCTKVSSKCYERTDANFFLNASISVFTDPYQEESLLAKCLSRLVL